MSINTRIRHKRDTSAEWTRLDPLILDGELILVDTAAGELRAKIGDGVKTYTQLPFLDENILTKIISLSQEVEVLEGYLSAKENAITTFGDLINTTSTYTIADNDMGGQTVSFSIGG